MTNILFVCSANKDRSPTAESIYANHPGLKVKSAGVSPYCTRIAVSEELLTWADVILCMEKWQQTEIEDKFAAYVKDKVIDSLGVADMYPYMHPVLAANIKEKVDAWLIDCNRSTLGGNAGC